MKHGIPLLAVFAVMVGIFLIANQVSAESDQPVRDGEKLVTIYDRGIQRTVLTRAASIKEALADAGIALDPNDSIEPSLDEKLIASEYHVNIYRARPVIVVDEDGSRQRIMTSQQTPERIVKSADITLHPEDKVSTERTTNVIADGASLVVAIDRATPFIFTQYGKTYTARTQSTTVGEMLREKGLTLEQDDRLSADESTPITAGMTLRLWREGKQTITVTEEVDFEVEKIQDADRPTGYRDVKVAGVKGERNATYEVVIQDGHEIARTEIASVTTKPSEKQVEIVGTKPEYLPYTGGGSKTEWLSASNIPQEHWGYADFMVQKESGWNPNAVNRSSGACGLAQALPCSKVGSDPHNPIVSLNWMNGYVNGRYGGWPQAYAFWQTNRWY